MNKNNYRNLKKLQYGGGFQIYVKTLTGSSIALDIDEQTDTLTTVKDKMIRALREHQINPRTRETVQIPLIHDTMKWIIGGVLITEHNFAENLRLLHTVETTHLVISGDIENPYKNEFIATLVDSKNGRRIHEILEEYINTYNEYTTLSRIIASDRKLPDLPTMKMNIHACVRDRYYRADDIPNAIAIALYTTGKETKAEHVRIHSEKKLRCKTLGKHIWDAVDGLVKKILNTEDTQTIEREVPRILYGMPQTFNTLFVEGIASHINKETLSLEAFVNMGVPVGNLGAHRDTIAKYRTILRHANESLRLNQYVPLPTGTYTTLYDRNVISDECVSLLYDMSIQLLN